MTPANAIDLPTPPMPWGGIVAASLASSVLTLGLPISVLQVYDRVLPNQSMSTLGVLVMTLIVVVILDALLKVFRGQLLSWTAAKYEYQLGCALTSSLLDGRLDLLEHDGPGTQSRRLAAIDNLKGFYCGTAATAVFDLPLVLISLALVTLIGGWLVVVPLALTAVFLLTGWLVGNRLHAILSDRNTSDDRRQNFLVELFSGIDSVKSLVLEEQMRRRYERLIDGADPLVYRAAQLTAVVRGMSDAFAQLMVVVVASAAAWLVVQGEMSLGEMAACTLLCGRTLQPTLQTLGLWSQYQTTRIAREQLAAGLSIPAQKSGSMQPELKGGFALRRIGYLHPKTRVTLFDGLDLRVDPGEIVGIRGGDGSGKSSLVQILMGIASPESGEVVFDDMPLEDIDLRFLRSQIGVVGERAPRFNGTLMENLTLFQGEDVAVDEAELLRLLGIEEAVARLAQGYSTRIHAGATDASESLLQRVGIARALLKRPKILILDEANNGLDQEGDRHLAELLVHLKGRMTVLLITQRPSLLEAADRKLELVAGQLQPIQKPKLAGSGNTPGAIGGPATPQMRER
ncbi:MAG: peptidase domain-containing ABC transporter [Geminicoccaceae bacterium]